MSSEFHIRPPLPSPGWLPPPHRPPTLAESRYVARTPGTQGQRRPVGHGYRGYYLRLPSPLERENVFEERKMISTHISSVETKLKNNFQSRQRLLSINHAFVRWRNVGRQLCYASIGEQEPDHDLEQ